MAREMMWRWISEVPSQIRSTRVSRHRRSSGNSSIRPIPPNIWMASSVTYWHISLACNLAMAASVPVIVPCPSFQAALRVSNSAAS